MDNTNITEENINNEKGAFCPNCGHMAVIGETCGNCHFSFGEVLTCPCLTTDKRCLRTKRECDKKGLQWEMCEKMREG